MKDPSMTSATATSAPLQTGDLPTGRTAGLHHHERDALAATGQDSCASDGGRKLAVNAILSAGEEGSRVANRRRRLKMAFEHRLSSGVFGLPSGAVAVDWMLINNTDSRQDFRVTVFECPTGATKSPASPGPLELSVGPRKTTHNANDVGPGQPFSGLPIEVVFQLNDLKVLPTVEVWSDQSGTVIPGTRIGPRDFSRLV
jgi:hypothetical protein